jgi:hypothetical protein
MTATADEYRFSDFTRQNYDRLLGIAAKTWKFRGYTDFDRQERFLILRHDIDMSPQSALKIATIESERGIRATYFVNFHSEFYNLLERGITAVLRNIAAQGHAIGLHFDSHFYGIESEAMLENHLREEAQLLSKLLGVKVECFSFHNTTPFTMSCRRWTYADLINAYASYFQDSVGYCSDSTGYWRFRRLEDVLTEAKENQLVVLTHADHWQDEPMAPRQRILRSITGRAQRTIEGYDTFMAKAGHKNIDE